MKSIVVSDTIHRRLMERRIGKKTMSTVIEEALDEQEQYALIQIYGEEI